MSRRALAAVYLAFAFAAGPLCAAPSKPPYELVRSLHVLQDQIVLGNRTARVAVSSLATELATRLLSYNPSVWREPRNARAVVTYVLSGGAPRVAETILASGDCAPQEKPLVEAAVAYSEGHVTRARTLLANVDARTLEPIVGGHIALAQAALVASKDPYKAIELLDVARVLAPGTLIEEAALRREIFIINATGDFDRFISLSGDYIRRFRNSTYADNFREHFCDAIARLNITGDSDQLAQIDDALSSLPTGDQLKLYLMIARASILMGKIPAAEFAAAKAESLASPDSAESGRAQLYDGAAQIFTPSYARGDGLLDTLNASRLSREEVGLKDAAQSVSQQIHEWPQVDARQPLDSAGAQPLPQQLKAVMQSSDATMDAAQKALAESDSLEAKQP
jgi:chemotaxis protein MotC